MFIYCNNPLGDFCHVKMNNILMSHEILFLFYFLVLRETLNKNFRLLKVINFFANYEKLANYFLFLKDVYFKMFLLKNFL